MLLSELSALGSRVLRMRQLTLSLRSVTTFVVPDSEDEDEKKGRLAREKVLTPRLPQGLPKPDDFEVKSAQLVNKSVSLHRCPPPLKPEFAFIGHSNVGKSSLINMLAREEVTLTSSKPGASLCGRGETGRRRKRGEGGTSGASSAPCGHTRN